MHPGGAIMRKYVVLFVILSLLLFGAIVSYAATPGLNRMPGANDGVWTHIGPGDAEINDIAVDPTNADRMLAAIDREHLTETTDGGTSWHVLNSSPTDILVVTIDPQNPNTVLIGDANYTYRSGDGGATWSDPQLKSFTWTSDIWMKPDNSKHILVATTHDLARPYGVHVNTQYGWGSWTRTFSGKSLTLASDPNNPATVYLGTDDR